DGTYTFTPLPDFNGAVPVVTYLVEDGIGDTNESTLTIVVTPESDLIDDNEYVEIAEDEVASGSVLTNASSPEAGLKVTSFSVDSDGDGIDETDHAVGTPVTIADKGTLLLNEDGTYTFTPLPDFNGAVPVVTYLVEDGIGDTNESTLTIVVTPESDLIDDNEYVEIAEDEVASGSVLTNASSPEAGLKVTSFSVDSDGDGIDETDHAVGTPVAIADKGTLLLNEDGTYTFTPLPDFNGAVPVVTYIVEDGIGDTNESTLTIVVTPADNIPPVAEDDGFSIYQGESVSGNLITHVDGNDGIADHDGGDGAVLTITQINGVDLVFGADGFATVNVDGGAVTINAAGDFTYNNSDGYILGSDYPSFNYTLSDGTDTDIATVTIDIDDSAPVAVNDYNYLTFSDLSDFGRSDITGSSSIGGNVITGRTSDDHMDTSDDGLVTIVKFNYNGSDFIFNDDVTSHTIITTFGTFIMDNTGEYSFELPLGTKVAEIPDNLNIVYTIEDSDTNNPETDDATLEINFTYSNEVTSSSRTSSEEKLIEIPDVIEDQDQEVPDQLISYDMAELFSETNNESIEEYMQFDALVENSALKNTSQSNKEELILETDTQDVAKAGDTETIVTNSLLKEGATLINDASPENVPQQIELDSNDHI
ncbi:tandem-95 repeat protein, partial [Colwellia sp. 5_MG-2023]|uniref:Ig-like domain-containing protein n=2 Tax=unclassified Colwellia TaxID=196834 RepID=UPI0026E3573B